MVWCLFSRKVSHSIFCSILLLLSLLKVGSLENLTNPFTFKYVINNQDLCSSGLPLDLLIWVHSGPANLRRRVALRETWANPHNMPASLKTKMVFFLGVTKDEKLQKKLEYESELYRDLVQESYVDSYRNLTYKAMSGLKWIDKYCMNISLVLKSDDDMLVYTEKLMSHIQSLTEYPKPIRNTIICDVWVNRKVERGKGMKWSESEFTRDHYPTYCPGLALILSADLIAKLWHQALETKYFWVDDVFFTGLLVEKFNVTWVQMGSTFHFGGKILSTNFIRHPREFIFGHVLNYRTDLFYYLWQSMSLVSR